MTVSSQIRVLIVVAVLAAAPALLADKWNALEEDGLHDTDNPALKLLQDPEEALSVLAPDSAGNQVNWVEAVRLGQIRPLASLTGQVERETHDTDVIMSNTLSLPPVRFPHKAHNEWMSCEMCHDRIFVPEIDGNDISMARILEGEYCGLCHGAVSFPLTECNRCHSVVDTMPRVPASSGSVDREP